MRATIDVPDSLYRRVKARAALEGRAVRDVTIERYERWLNESESPQRTLDDPLRAQSARARIIRGVRRYQGDRDPTEQDALAIAAELPDEVLLSIRGIGPGALAWLRQVPTARQGG